MLLFIAVTAWSQNVVYHYEDKIHIDTALNQWKSYVFTASDEILLDSAFQRNSRYSTEPLSLVKCFSTDFRLDQLGVYPPHQGLQGGEDENDRGCVGSLGGVIDVGKLGGAVYAIPIDLPQGVNGMQPDLSLLYNSQARNGLLGWCWDLAGLSAITRTGKTRYHDGFCGGVTLDDYNDRFLLDGMRLIRCINYGADSIMYKMEQDDMSRIVAYTCQHNGNRTIQNFKVWKADGTIVEYGFDNEHTHSRIEPQTGSDKALCWLVNKISDRNGNAIEFFYSTTQETGEYYVDHIDYISNARCGISPAFRISFQYEDTQNPDFCFVAGNILQSKKVLKNISAQRTDGTQHQMARYSFKYEDCDVGKRYDSIKMFKRLERIDLEKDGMAVNPTRIEWSCYGKQNIDILEQQRNISPNIYKNFPFVGDFNGDGYSDLAVVPFKGNTLYYPDNIDIKIHFHKGEGTSNFYATPSVSIQNIDKTLDWIHVLDINDDGFDDIVTVCYDSIATGDTTKIMVYKNTNGTGFTPAWAQPLWFTSKALVTIGDFEGTGKQSFIACALKYDNDTPRLSNFTYVHCENGWCYTDAVKFGNGEGHILGAYQIASGDFSGRGHTDLLFLRENVSNVYGINNTGSSYRFEFRFSNQDINHTRPTDQVFTGDFNGDGMTDILKYNKISNNNSIWNIHYSKGAQFSQGFCAVNLDGIQLPEYKLYSYSLRKLISFPDVPQGRSYGICPADFDGDGVTDIAVLRYKTSAGSPYSSIDIYFRFRPKQDNPNECKAQSIFDSGWYNGSYGPHGGNAYYFGCHSQYLHIGTFTKKGNASFLCLEYRESDLHHHERRPGVFTFKSARDLNNMKSITDGLGNKRDLSYTWQMQPYQKFQHGVVRLAVPMHVLDCHIDTMMSGKPKQVRYGYHDLCYHKDGHGFLGYRRTVRTDVENGEKVGQTVSCASLEPMNEYAMLLPSNDSVFVYLNENKVLSNTTRYTFRRAFESSSEGLKAGCPAMLKKQTKHFNIDDGGSFLYREIKEYSYNFTVNFDIHNYPYYFLAYACDTTRTGISANYVSQVADCEFRTTESVVYSQNDHFKWIVNRPEQRTVVQSMANKPDIVKTTVIEYEPDSPYLPKRITEIPDTADSQDPLTLQTDYEYYENGNLKKETTSAPYGQLGERTRSTTYEYGPGLQQRLLTKETLKGGTHEYETSYDYDLNDNLISMTDCNGLITQHDEDALGITQTTTLADSTVACQALRWAKNADYAPEGASYYRWERKTGQPKSLVFYHRSGLELRQVSFGLRGEPVFIDKAYDDRDRLLSVTAPYKEGETPQHTVFEYDNINRITAQTTPDGTRTEYHHDGLSTTTDIVPTEGLATSSTITKNPAGWIKSSTDASNVTINFDYYADGTLASSQVGNNAASRIEMQYDHWGNRSQLSDPDYGTIHTVHNAYGLLVREETPKHDITKYDYDYIGRLIVVEDTGEGTTTHYDYDESHGRKGTLKRIRHGDQTIRYKYDDFLRVTNTVETWNGIDYDTELDYDRASRVCSIRYPSGYTALFDYTPSGHAHKITDAAGNLLWQLDDMNARGQMLQATLGNGLVTRHTYTDDMHYIDSIITSNNLQNLTYHYDKFGNLAARKDNKRNLTETFTYDNLNRLKTTSMGGLTASMTYDNLGRMTGKQDIVGGGQAPQVRQVFSAPAFDATKIHAMVEATAEQGVFPPMDQNISYTSFDKVKYLGEGKNRLTYLYGFNRQRIASKAMVNDVIRGKTYIGNCEFVTENDHQRTLTYLTGPYGVFAVVEQQNGVENVHFVLKDHLGSWTTITDEYGNVEREQSYDAWGNMRDPETWLNYTAPELAEGPMFDRGYTGHEHMTAFGLINMNGRCYDPVTSSFLSVDRFVQSPDNSQGFNRYAYCMYNPLRYIDPSGWLPGKPSNSRPDSPPGLGNYHPGIYNPTDSESAWLVRLPDVDVIATSLGSNANTTITPYTEGTIWDNNHYLDKPKDTGPVLYETPIGHGGGGGIGMGPNNHWGNSKLTPSVVNYPTATVSTLLGASSYSYLNSNESLTDLGKSLTKAQKAKLAAKYPKELSKGASAAKYGRVVAGKMGKAGNVLGAIGVGVSVYDVMTTEVIRPSNIYEITTSMTCVVLAYVCSGPVGWIAGAVVLGAEIISYSYTGMSVGENLNQRIDWNYNKYQ